MSRLARVTFEARPAGIAWTLAAGPGGPVRSARTTPTGPNRRVSSCGRSCGGRTWVTPKSTNQPDCGHFRSLDLAVGALGSKLNRALAPVAARRWRDGRPQCANSGRSPMVWRMGQIDPTWKRACSETECAAGVDAKEPARPAPRGFRRTTLRRKQSAGRGSGKRIAVEINATGCGRRLWHREATHRPST
jgi:hypothetical protein